MSILLSSTCDDFTLYDTLKYRLNDLIMKIIFLAIPFFLCLFSFSQENAFAQSGDKLNREDTIRILQSHFPLPVPEDYSPTAYFNDVQDAHLSLLLSLACDNHIFDCSSNTFDASQAISLPASLKTLFGYIAQTDNTDYFDIAQNDSSEWFTPFMEEAHKRGIIDQDVHATLTMAPQTFDHIVERVEVLRSYYYAVPYYFYGLARSPEDLQQITFDNLTQIDQAQQNYEDTYVTLLNIMHHETNYADKIRYAFALARIKALKLTIDEKYHTMHENPILYDTTYSGELREKFREYGIKEVIGVGYYDFRHNAAYRKTNIRNSLDNVEGLILQPDEEFNYWNIMETVGLQDIVNGWLLVDGKEVWGWGGGLCGTATTIFRAAWFSGLDIVERRPHTVYYSDLYAPADIGLDAAVYQYSPNLRFVNNTGHPIMFHIKWNANKDEAWLEVLGTKPFKNLTFSGLQKAGGSYKRSRTFEFENGETKTDSIYSSYNKIY